MPKISVIMSVYNARQYLTAGVNAVLNNTYTDFELLLIDDGSTDGTAELLQQLAAADARIRLFSMPKNGGQAAARNFGIAQSRGEYLLFADADDRLEPDALACLLGAMDNACDVVLCGFFIDIPQKGSQKLVCPPAARLSTREEVLQHFQMLKDTFLLDAAWNKLYRADLIKRNGLQMPAGEIFEDTEFALRVLEHTSHIQLLNKPLYHYIQHGGSTTRKFNPQKLTFLKQRYSSMLRYFGPEATPALTGYAAQFLLSAYYSFFADLFLPSAKMAKKVIRQTIKAYIAQPEFVSATAAAVARGRVQKFTLWAAKQSPLMQYFYARAIYTLKYKLQGIFLRLK